MDHQVEGAAHLINLATDPLYRGGLLAHDMGLGKTGNFFCLWQFMHHLCITSLKLLT